MLLRIHALAHVGAALVNGLALAIRMIYAAAALAAPFQSKPAAPTVPLPGLARIEQPAQDCAAACSTVLGPMYRPQSAKVGRASPWRPLLCGSPRRRVVQRRTFR
jgi:hypothetical protein